MTMLRKVLIIGLLAASLAACNEPYESKASYFNGSVTVEYLQTRSRSSDDYLTVRFYDPGTYQISFEGVPGKSGRGSDKMPKPFTITVSAAREVIIRQFVLPDFIRVRVIKDGTEELHDFS